MARKKESDRKFFREVLMCENKQCNAPACFVFRCLQVFLAKVLNHMLPSITLGSIESKWVSRDKKQVGDKCWWASVASSFVIELSGMCVTENRVCEVSGGKCA